MLQASKSKDHCFSALLMSSLVKYDHRREMHREEI